MTPYPHQTEIARRGFEILSEYGIVYLSMEERTGKTLTSVLIAERSNISLDVLIVTKKNAIDGWKSVLSAYEHKQNYTIINYESLHKVSQNFDLCICDEAHYRLSAYPKPSATQKLLKSLCFKNDAPVIYLSATPSAESYSQLFHQFALTPYSPWKQKTFYDWFRIYGIPQVEFIAGRAIKKYNMTKEELIREHTAHLFISKSRAELGFKHSPVDKLHYIELETRTKSLLKLLKTKKVIEEYGYAAESVLKEITALHQIEGGTLKLNDTQSIVMGNTEKIDYIKAVWGDLGSIAIMYNYIAEGELLREHFKNAKILSGISNAEGVDLSAYTHLIIYSMNFSASKFIQRRARQCNIEREDEILVHFIICKNCVSELVYNCIVRDKLNFTQSYYIAKEGGDE